MKQDMTTLILVALIALAVGFFAGKNMEQEEYYKFGRGRPCTRGSQCMSGNCSGGKCK